MRSACWSDARCSRCKGPAPPPRWRRSSPISTDTPFMGWRAAEFRGAGVFVSRSGYTGEDGFEMSVRNYLAQSFAEALLEHPDVAPAGLGARDSLRLEAGLCLYGHDLDATTDPVEAGLAWSIGRRRREARRLSRLQRIRAALTEGPRANASGFCPRGGRLCAKARRWRRRTDASSVVSPRAAIRRRSRGPSPWPMSKRPSRPRRRAGKSPSRQARPGRGRLDAFRPASLFPRVHRKG